MSLTAHLYEASRARRSVVLSESDDLIEERIERLERRPLDPALVSAMERVVDRELPAYRAGRLAALGERELVERIAHEPAPAPRALPMVTVPSVRPPLRRTLDPCSVCGGAVRVQHVDLDTGVAHLECSECGRHWSDAVDSRIRRVAG